MNSIERMIGLLFIGILLSGCGEPNRQTGSGTNLYPVEVSGIWKAENQPWAFKVEPDGSISRVYHEVVGPIKVSEGGADWGPGDEGSFAVFVLGECKTEYRPFGRILKVTVNLESFHIKVPQGELQGRTEDYFEGPVSKDGKTWTAAWRQYGYLDGAAKPDKEYIDAHPEKVIFHKVDPAFFKTMEKPATEDSK